MPNNQNLKFRFEIRENPAALSYPIEKALKEPLLRLLIFLFWAIAALSLIVVLANLLGISDFGNLLFGLALIILAVFIKYLALRFFYFKKVKKYRLAYPLANLKDYLAKDQNYNFALLFSAEALCALFAAGEISGKKDLYTFNCEDLIKGLLKREKMGFVLNRIGISEEQVVNYLKASEELNLDQFFYQTLEVAIMETHEAIEEGDLIVALSEDSEIFKKLLFNLKIKPIDLANVVYWATVQFREEEEEKKIYDPDHIKRTGGIGKEWAYGYMLNLKNFTIDLITEIENQGKQIHFIGHRREIRRLEQALIGAESHNAILVGEPGVGKKTIVYGFAKAISEGSDVSSMAHFHVLELNLDRVLAGAREQGELVARLEIILYEAVRTGNVILFIDNIHNLFSTDQGVGRIDATPAFMPFLSHPGLYIVGATDTPDYQRFIGSRGELAQKFTRIDVAEPSEQETLRIIEDVIPYLEKRAGILFSYQAVREIVKLSKRLVVDQPFPEKAIDFLDEVATYVRSRTKDKLVTEKHVDQIVTEKTKVPVGELTEEERTKLLNLEDFLHQRVVDQEEAIVVVSDAMRRARAEIKEENKPVGSYLFLGPTGVGKTETAKALAEAYFGDVNRMIRFDMSEYQGDDALYRFIGTPEGVGSTATQGEFTQKIIENPFSLVLLDEIEKANPLVLNLFLQVLDEGFITESSGRKVILTNNIIIATSNAGAEVIREAVQENIPYSTLQQEILDYLLRQGIFRPEFLNRFSSIVTFRPLGIEEIRLVAGKMIAELKVRIEKEKEIHLEITEPAVAKLAILGFDPTLGARPMQRVIQGQLENLIAKKVLSHQAERGSTVLIDKQDIADKKEVVVP